MRAIDREREYEYRVLNQERSPKACTDRFPPRRSEDAVNESDVGDDAGANARSASGFEFDRAALPRWL